MDQYLNSSGPLVPPPRHRGRRPKTTSTIQHLIRCQCGEKNEENLIECEHCKTWQHKDCVGLVNTSDATNYKCDICEPRTLKDTKCETDDHQVVQEKNSKKARVSKKSSSANVEHFLKFLVRKTKNIGSPFVMKHFFEEYKNFSGYEGLPGSLVFWFRRNVVPNIPDLPKLNIDTKVRMLFATSCPVDEKFLKELRVMANVEVDELQRITKYKSNHSRLQLEGKHSMKGKGKNFKKKIASKKRTAPTISQPRSFSQSVESDNEKEEEMEDEKEDEKEKEKKDKKEEEKKDEEEEDEDEVEVIHTSQGEASNPISMESEPVPIVEFPMESDEAPGNGNTNTHFGTSNHDNAYHKRSKFATSYACSPINVMTSCLNLMNSQTDLVRKIISKGSSAEQRGSHSGTSSGSNDVAESSSVKEFLKFFQMYIVSLDSLRLSEVYHKIQMELQKFGTGDKKIPMKNIQSALESAFAISIASGSSFRNIASKSTSAKDFFQLLQMYAFNQNSHQLSGICKKLKSKVIALEKDETEIPIDQVGRALESAIAIMLQ